MEPTATARIGASIVVRGEIVAQEDVLIAGRVEGSIRIEGHRVVVAPGAEVIADIHAREVVVSGHVLGNLSGERIDLRETADLEGNLTTPVLKISDGATFRGRVDMKDGKRRMALAS
jgi:cytoskeletal protein CcmA (bactofilin family)